ncbi:MAG TPA: hypothetical protein PK198_26400, partial [Saprospiraceae bacterium]|nr:hypothetical protein [Saprospiraceae bacterium]
MEWKNYPYESESWEKQWNRIAEKKGRLDQLRPLPAIAVQNIRDSLALEWTHHSNGIEGNTLTLQETKMEDAKFPESELA